MTMQENLTRSKAMLLLALGMIFMAAFSRLIPHAPNFTAVTAMALFAGSKLPNRILAILVPLAALLLSDLVIGFYDGMIYTYVAFAIIAAAAFLVLKNTDDSKAWVKIGSSSLVASFFFFAFSNFGVWITSGMYERSLLGLANCYIMALPFLENQVLGDLFFSGLLFGAYALVKLSIADSSRAL